MNRDEGLVTKSISREEFEAIAQHYVQSLRFKDPLMLAFRTACSYGAPLANGKLSAGSFSKMCINAKICIPQKRGSQSSVSLSEILSSSEALPEDPTAPDLRDAVVSFGQKVHSSGTHSAQPSDTTPAPVTAPISKSAVDQERVQALWRRLHSEKKFDEAEKKALYKPVWRNIDKYFNDLETVNLGAGNKARSVENNLSMAKTSHIVNCEVTEEMRVRSVLRLGKDVLQESDIRDMFWSVVSDCQDANLHHFVVLLLVLAQRLYSDEFYMNHQAAFAVFLTVHVNPYVHDMTPQTLDDMLKLRPVQRIPDVGLLLKQHEAITYNLFRRFASFDVGGKSGMSVDAFVDLLRYLGIAGLRLPHEKLYEIARIYENSHDQRYAALGIIFDLDQFVEALILVAFAMYNNVMESDKLPTVASRLQCFIEILPPYYNELFGRPFADAIIKEELTVPAVTHITPDHGNLAGGYEISIKCKDLNCQTGGYVKFGDMVVAANSMSEYFINVHVPECEETDSFDVSVYHSEGTIYAEVIMKKVVGVTVSNDGEQYSEVHKGSLFTYEDHKPHVSMLDFQSKLLRIFSNYCHIDDPKNTKHLAKSNWVRFLKDFKMYDDLTREAECLGKVSKEDNSHAILYFNRCAISGALHEGTFLRYNGFLRALCMCIVSFGRSPNEMLRALVSTDQWIGRELLLDAEIMQKGEFRDKLRFITNSFSSMQTLENAPHVTSPRNPQDKEADQEVVGEGTIVNLGELDAMFRLYLIQRQNDDQITAAESALYKSWITGSSMEQRKREAQEREVPNRIHGKILIPNVDGVDPRDGLLMTNQQASGLLRGVQRDRMNLLMRRENMERIVHDKKIGKLEKELKQKDQLVEKLNGHLVEYVNRERQIQLDQATVAHGVLRSEKELWQISFNQQLEHKMNELEALMVQQENQRDIERDRILNQFRMELQLSESALAEMNKVLEEQSLFLARQGTVMEAMNIRMRILQAENAHHKVSQDDLLTMVQRDKYPERYSDWVQKNVRHKENVDVMLKKLMAVVNANKDSEGIADLLNLPAPSKQKAKQWDKADIAGLVRDNTAVANPFASFRVADSYDQEEGPRSPMLQRASVYPDYAMAPLEGGAVSSEEEDQSPVISVAHVEEIVKGQDEKMAKLEKRFEVLHDRLYSIAANAEAIKKFQNEAANQPSGLSPQLKSSASFRQVSRQDFLSPRSVEKRIVEVKTEFIAKEGDYKQTVARLEAELENVTCPPGTILYYVKPEESLLDVASLLGCSLQELAEHCGLTSPAIPKEVKYLKISTSLLFKAVPRPLPSPCDEKRYDDNKEDERRHRDHGHGSEKMLMEYARVFQPGVSLMYHNVIPTDTVDSICEQYGISRSDLLLANFIPVSTENADVSIQGVASRKLRIPYYSRRGSHIVDERHEGAKVRATTLSPKRDLAPKPGAGAPARTAAAAAQRPPPSPTTAAEEPRTLEERLTSMKSEVLTLRETLQDMHQQFVHDSSAMEESMQEGMNRLMKFIDRRNMHTQALREPGPRSPRLPSRQKKKGWELVKDMMVADNVDSVEGKVDTVKEELLEPSAQTYHHPGDSSLDAFLKRHGGVTGGWSELDHREYLRQAAKGKGFTISGKSSDEVSAHTAFYQEYTARLAANREAETVPPVIPSPSHTHEPIQPSYTLQGSACLPVQKSDPGGSPEQPSTIVQGSSENNASTHSEIIYKLQPGPTKKYQPKEFILYQPPTDSTLLSEGLPVVLGKGSHLCEQPSPHEVVRVALRKKTLDMETSNRQMILVEWQEGMEVLEIQEKSQRPINYADPKSGKDIARYKYEEMKSVQDHAKVQRLMTVEKVKAANILKQARMTERRTLLEAELQQRHMEAASKRQQRAKNKKPPLDFSLRAPALSSPSVPDLPTAPSYGQLAPEGQKASPKGVRTEEVENGRKILPPMQKTQPNALSTSLPLTLQQQLRSLQTIEETLRVLPHSQERTEALQTRYAATVMKYLHKPSDSTFTNEEQQEVDELRHFLSHSYDGNAAIVQCMETVAQTVPKSWAPVSRSGRGMVLPKLDSTALQGPSTKVSVIQTRPTGQKTKNYGTELFKK